MVCILRVATGELAMREVYCMVQLIAKAVSEVQKKRNQQEKDNFIMKFNNLIHNFMWKCEIVCSEKGNILMTKNYRKLYLSNGE